jgi:beta-phosphoglucomutase family hydrolase
MYKAFLFDLNGTMIDDMSYHVKAWYDVFKEAGAAVTMEETKRQCYGKNQELVERIFPGRFSDEEIQRMSLEKERKYQRSFRPHLKLIRGLDDFLEDARKAGIRLAIGTAAIRHNVDFVLNGLKLHTSFDVIVSADDVINSKPDPETFLKCAGQLEVKNGECLVFEDSPKGTEAAKRAGMDCLAITTMHTRHEFDESNILDFIDTYDSVRVSELLSNASNGTDFNKQ